MTIFLMLMFSGGLEAEACLNDMNKRKKTTTDKTPRSKDAQSPTVIKKGVNPPTKKDVKTPATASDVPTKSQEPSQEPSEDTTIKEALVTKEAPQEQTPEQETPTTAAINADAEAPNQPSSCSHVSLMLSVWGLCAWLPLLIRRRA